MGARRPSGNLGQAVYTVLERKSISTGWNIFSRIPVAPLIHKSQQDFGDEINVLMA